MPEVARLDDCSARPHAEVFADPPRTVRLALEAGESVPAHRHPGEWVLVHVLEGRLAVTVDDAVHDLDAGELLRFNGDSEVSPEAREDAVALVTFAPATDDGG